jgi:hypothetical protein
MTGTHPSRLALGIAAALAFAACGKSHDNTKPSTSATVGPAGATLSAGAATVTFPAGALAQPTPITVREAEPQHQGRTLRVEIEPHGQALTLPARLAVRFDDSNARVKLVDDNGTLHSVEVEDRNHGEYKTPMDHLGEIEVELEHGTACTPACTTGQECDDGVCKAHVEHPEARSCSPVCDTGQECDDGTCKAHVEVEPHDVGTTCVPSCASGMRCDNGVCHT